MVHSWIVFSVPESLLVQFWTVFKVPFSLLVQFWIVFKVPYSLLVQFWTIFYMPDSFFIQLGTNDLLNSWIETNNVQEGELLFGQQRRKEGMRRTLLRGQSSKIVDAGLEGGRVTLCLIRSVQWRY